MKRKYLLSIFICFILQGSVFSQNALNRFLTPSDTFNKTRFWAVSGIGLGIAGGSIGSLASLWYAQYEQTRFHLFNDWGEWERIDKTGHFLTAYHESRWSYEGASWTGMSHRSSVWTGVAIGTAIQGTLEFLDGFSKKWGYSLGDITANELGCALFAAQELGWQEQRIVPKISFSYPNYPDAIVTSTDGKTQSSVRARVASLYGNRNLIESFFKDYNGETYWLCGNISSFLPKGNSFPKWLNLAVGYGAEGMYGGFDNSWTDKNGAKFVLDTQKFPRYRQVYLSLDVDLSKIKTDNPILKTLFSAVRFLKFPAPTVEFNTLGRVKFFPIFY